MELRSRQPRNNNFPGKLLLRPQRSLRAKAVLIYLLLFRDFSVSPKLIRVLAMGTNL